MIEARRPCRQRSCVLVRLRVFAGRLSGGEAGARYAARLDQDGPGSQAGGEGLPHVE